MLHRDLKPSNIILNPDTFEIKVIDFGLAIQLSDFVEEETTLCGTPNYMAPEVL